MNTRFKPGPRITDVESISGLTGGLFFYTKREAATYAASIGWPKNSAKLFKLPYGRQAWAISDAGNQQTAVVGGTTPFENTDRLSSVNTLSLAPKFF